MRPLPQLLAAAADVAPSPPVESILTGLDGSGGKILLGIACLSTGLVLLLLHKGWIFRVCGWLLSVAGMSFFMMLILRFGSVGQSIGFWILAGLTLAASAATITSASPVYSAIWFAISLLGMGGLFLVQGAQFLGVATVAVYAGAIVVTFLFVLMLAQPEGQAPYDRISWGKLPMTLAVVSGATVIGGAAYVLQDLESFALAPNVSENVGILHPQHVAVLGSQLFSTHLIAVQLAGTLLLVALVGAVAISMHGRETDGQSERTRGSKATTT